MRCQVLEGYVYFDSINQSSPEPGSNGEDKTNFLLVKRGTPLSNIDFRFAPFKTGRWTNYTHLDGLAGNVVNAIHHHRDGMMWFATNGGVSGFDGKSFVNYTTSDGLVNNRVTAIHSRPDGTIWFGTNGGVSRFDGKTFVNYTTSDGLVDNGVIAIHSRPDGTIWFGTLGGVSRFDGEVSRQVSSPDGIGVNYARSRDSGDRDSNFLVHAKFLNPALAGREQFVNFTTRDGLAHNAVLAIHPDTEGRLWFGTRGGVSQFDGKRFVNFTTEDGLPNNYVYAIDLDAEGQLWFGTDGGVSRFDGKAFLTFHRIKW